jgi:hypothetical protein
MGEIGGMGGRGTRVNKLLSLLGQDGGAGICRTSENASPADGSKQGTENDRSLMSHPGWQLSMWS